ncbi:dihydrofolate reductase family protein [Fodinibius salsisoli]|uniref:Dihydrofolate reductase n=1 Tax=Fodinibius salsisoli TaxID=2820877 RepID=A0ABT3PIF3_9BACT|nr:dihydrofolate reductase family protein [Fodinibius salsisoli]MCW9705533.1 dihydrofolate reductase [Fodinibius salsisoli]
MQKLRVESFSISIDGFGAGPNQSLDNPLGEGAEDLHQWFFPTKTFQQSSMGKDEGTTGTDNDFASRGFTNIGAWIMGRNMFGPIRGPWPDEKWKGWWGENPPYHVPVFVLTNHKRRPIEMKGGTTFYFVTEGIHNALDRAREAAGDKDVRLGGGVSTIRQYLTAKLIDEMHLAISPVLLGRGEHLFSEIDLPALGYLCTDHVTTDQATHVVITKELANSSGK